MKKILVLGPGCSNCKTTMKLIEEAASNKGVEVSIEKIEEISEIMAYQIMSTPGVVIDGVVVHSGGIPSKNVIDSWLTDEATGSCSGNASTESSNCCS